MAWNSFPKYIKKSILHNIDSTLNKMKPKRKKRNDETNKENMDKFTLYWSKR